MLTVADIVDPVRDILQDRQEPYRYPTDSLMRALYMGLLQVRTLRPDHYIGTFHHTMPRPTGLNDYVAVSEQLLPSLVAYVAGVAELRDDEFTTDGRASALLDKFRRDLMGAYDKRVSR
jgi:hypothetical protein